MQKQNYVQDIMLRRPPTLLHLVVIYAHKFVIQCFLDYYRTSYKQYSMTRR